MFKLSIIGFSMISALVIMSNTAQSCEFPCFNKGKVDIISKSKKKIYTVESKSKMQYNHNTGIASYYWQPQAVACGGKFNPNALTAAHRTYPCGTKVLVTNMRNSTSVTVTINDRGPFRKGRIIDLSLAAARQLKMTAAGLTNVSIQIQ